MYRNILFVLSILLLASCGSIEGLRDKSGTISNQGFETSNIESLAILPIKNNFPIVGLSETLEVELAKTLQAQLPAVKIISANDFKSRIIEQSLISDYSQWRTVYDEMNIISYPHLKKWSQTLETQYYLIVNKAYLSREKMNGVDTGYSGWVADASNVWRTDLRLIAQVIDTASGKVVWEGVGHSENVHSPRRIGSNTGFITWNEKNPEMDQYLKPMIKMAVDGLVANIALVAKNVVKSANSFQSKGIHETFKTTSGNPIAKQPERKSPNMNSFSKPPTDPNFSPKAKKKEPPPDIIYIDKHGNKTDERGNIID